MENLSLLNQLIETLGESVEKLEDAYEKRDSELFNQMKKFAMLTQNRIDEVIE